MNAPGAMPKAAPVLVLPGGLAESLAFRDSAAAGGRRLIGASSLANDPAAARYDAWCHLPSIHDPGFDAAFFDLLGHHGIAAIFCPHAMIHVRLEELARHEGARFKLLNPPPQAAAEQRVASDLARGRAALPFMAALADGASSLSELEVAGLLRACEAITGQSDEIKLTAMMALFADLPKGDVVEIGGFWGRSAFALAWLAARFAIGPVLVVDPWDAGEAVQRSAPELVQRDSGRQDWDVIHKGFLLNLLPVAPGRLVYLRLTSAEGAAHYGAAPLRLDSPPFGNVSLSGDISLLHIDGNHDGEAVALDVALWLPRLRSGGWLVLDDYVWPHGDGPARAGDALLAELGPRAARSFVAGKALFVRIA
jgi:hypothetical protein